MKKFAVCLYRLSHNRGRPELAHQQRDYFWLTVSPFADSLRWQIARLDRVHLCSIRTFASRCRRLVTKISLHFAVEKRQGNHKGTEDRRDHRDELFREVTKQVVAVADEFFMYLAVPVPSVNL